MNLQPTFAPYPSYLDSKAAIAFLEAAFGFEVWSFGQAVDAAARGAWDAPGRVTRMADVHEPSA